MKSENTKKDKNKNLWLKILKWCKFTTIKYLSLHNECKWWFRVNVKEWGNVIEARVLADALSPPEAMGTSWQPGTVCFLGHGPLFILAWRNVRNSILWMLEGICVYCRFGVKRRMRGENGVLKRVVVSYFNRFRNY